MPDCSLSRMTVQLEDLLLRPTTCFAAAMYFPFSLPSVRHPIAPTGIVYLMTERTTVSSVRITRLGEWVISFIAVIFLSTSPLSVLRWLAHLRFKEVCNPRYTYGSD